MSGGEGCAESKGGPMVVTKVKWEVELRQSQQWVHDGSSVWSPCFLVSLFLYWHLGALLTLEGLLRSGLSIPRDRKHLACKYTFHTTPPLPSSPSAGLLSPYPSHAGQIPDNQGSPVAQSPEVIHTSLSSACWPCLACPHHGNHTEGSGPHSPLAPHPPCPGASPVALCGVAYPLLLGNG